MKRMSIVVSGALALTIIGGLLTYRHLAQQQLNLDLRFGADSASPVVLTDFAIEQELGPIPPTALSGDADGEMPRTAGGAVLSAPLDVARDGKWLVSARWVELPTDKAWTAQVEVPLDALTISYSAYTLMVLFGPNGELLIGSDKTGNQPSDRVDVVRICGARAPSADRAWQNDTGFLPEVAAIMEEFTPEPNKPTHCQAVD